MDPDLPLPRAASYHENGRAGLTRQFIRYGMMATVPHDYRAVRADYPPVGQWKSTIRSPDLPEAHLNK
jgi:hypothetical protein